MADYNIKLKREDLVALFTEDKNMANLLESTLNQVLEAQMEEHLGAERYEHSETRNGYRNGYRDRKIYTRVGSLTLRVPQTRDGSFSSELFQKYQRNEQALVLAMMEMYLSGISTRKVSNVTEELCGKSFSKSTVSELCTGLDARVNAWRSRPLGDKRYPFLIVDALVVDCRRDEAVRATGVLIVYGVTEDGKREPLDLLVADSENQASWEDIFQGLKDRGLHGVELVVSDAHEGLVNAVKKKFQGARWQRCQVHFSRNILGHTARHLRAEVADNLKVIASADDKKMARKLSKEFINNYADKVGKAIDNFEDGFEDAISVLDFPRSYRTRLRTTNLAERMNEEIRRRQRVIRIFPNEASAIRLIGALLADYYDTWQAQDRYFNMSEYWDWKKEREEPEPLDKKVVELR